MPWWTQSKSKGLVGSSAGSLVPSSFSVLLLLSLRNLPSHVWKCTESNIRPDSPDGAAAEIIKFKTFEISFHKSTKHAYKQAKPEPKVQMFDSKQCPEHREKQIMVRNSSTNICVLKQITLFCEVGHLIIPLGRESRRHFCSLSWHHSRSYTYTAWMSAEKVSTTKQHSLKV